jgi:hypothetical protein
LFWSPRLPWRTGNPVKELGYGWGVLLEEGLNWPVFLLLMFLVVVLSGLFVGIYAFKTQDHSTAVSIGTWLTAVQTLGVALVFYWFQ